MAETMKLAVPTMGEGGLQAERSGHFGHCDCFTLIDIADGEIKEVSIIQNPPHEEGGCLRPVGLLSDAGANAIVAAGMGMRPMMGFANAGIDVLFDNVTPNVGDVAKLADLVIMDRNLFASAPEELLEAKPLYTFIDGEVVYQAEGADLLK